MEGSERKTNTQENTGAPLQISDAIDRLLANPELLSSVASAIGVQPPTNAKADDKEVASEQKSAENEDNTDESSETASAEPATKDIAAKLPDLMANAAPILAALSGGGKGGKIPDDDRTRLLCALKPYVNPHRKEAIDTIVNLARISEVIKTIK